MHLLLLTHYYAPEVGAPQTRLRETAAGLSSLGHTVRVLTGPPHYPDGIVRPGYRTLRPSIEIVDGIGVRRLPMLPRRNGGLLDRSIDQGSFAAAAAVALGDARWADVILVESPPLFLGATAAWLRLVSGRPYVFHVADPWPDFPILLGTLGNPVARRAAFALEALAYHRATFVTTVTPGLVQLLSLKPGARGKVRLVPNGVDVTRFDPDRAPAAARRALGWDEARLHLVYAGSIGLAQGLATLVDAVAPLQEQGIVVHLVGEGFERRRLEEIVLARRLTHVRFHAAVPPSGIPEILAAADAVLVLLRSGSLYEHSLPTKLLEGLAAGRPIVVSAAGEAARIVKNAGAGVAAPPEDATALRDAILGLLDADLVHMGRSARIAAETGYDRRAIVRGLADLLSDARRPAANGGPGLAPP